MPSASNARGVYGWPEDGVEHNDGRMHLTYQRLDFSVKILECLAHPWRDSGPKDVVPSGMPFEAGLVLGPSRNEILETNCPRGGLHVALPTDRVEGDSGSRGIVQSGKRGYAVDLGRHLGEGRVVDMDRRVPLDERLSCRQMHIAKARLGVGQEQDGIVESICIVRMNWFVVRQYA
ncbi:hypothetical protein PG999_012172 [Apiospora kogelbergensis]|uniref:Uncharacterized protein n=1 Tax=Apiospora kogelbergensis TaxID=1337665 RepID=A0AAW0QKP9_9PEZI